ncbi:LCP family protein [Streptomyces sp. RFCAC02]|uniref:LCP family protein n=1 Tax=Streptomyces sp. RFCAC02 TaxID=2499143 RepID=UPI00101EA080|nr:LCP family protein [Streptomyces sp. RFCAC02]
MPTARRTRRRWGLRITAGLAGLVLTVSGAGHAMVGTVTDGLGRVDPFHGLENRPDAGRGLNVLLVGTDTREGLSAEERAALHVGNTACHCADAVLLLHLSADGDRADIVSLPRDTYAELPEHTFSMTGGHHDAHPDKLNAALSHGGPGLMVRTVEDLTGVRVDHYLEISFTSFMRAVDIIGGVRVCTTTPLEDGYSGLDLPAGTHTLDGAKALGYVRARHVDGGSDLGRVERQHRFLAAFLDQVLDSGTLLNPGRLKDTVTALTGSVSADHGLGAEEMLDLARAVSDLTTGRAHFGTVPVADPAHAVTGLGSTVLWDEAGADRLFRALREDRPLPAPPAGETPAGDGTGAATRAPAPTTADEFTC